MTFSLLQNWMAYTNIRIKNFTLTDSLVFTKKQLQLSRQANYAFCQVLQRKLLCGNYKVRSCSFVNRANKQQSLVITE